MTACHHISLINCTTSTDRKYLHWPLRVNKYKDQQIIFEIKCSRMLSILAEIESNIFSWKCVVSPLSDPLLYIQANKKKSVSEASVDIWMAFSICKLNVKICWEKFSWILQIHTTYDIKSFPGLLTALDKANNDSFIPWQKPNLTPPFWFYSSLRRWKAENLHCIGEWFSWW